MKNCVCYSAQPACWPNESQLNKWERREVQAQVTICLATSAGTQQPNRTAFLNTSATYTHSHKYDTMSDTNALKYFFYNKGTIWYTQASTAITYQFILYKYNFDNLE